MTAPLALTHEEQAFLDSVRRCALDILCPLLVEVEPLAENQPAEAELVTAQ